jgi:hypothetical protein
MRFRNILGLLFCLALFVFLYLHHNWGRMDGIDSHIFTAMGLHMNHGAQLYVDVWESKPINIYLLNAAALKIFGVEYSSIWIAQLLNGVLLCLLFFKLIKQLTLDQHLAIIGTLFFMWLFYFSGLYYSGNCTEEYGLTCLLLGIYAWLYSKDRESTRWLFISGFSFSMAFWFKEPFLFSMLPWLLFSLIYLLKRKNYRKTLTALSGLATPFVIYLSYFALAGSLDEVYKIFIYNQAYTQFMPLGFSEKLISGWSYFVKYFQYGGFIVPFVPLLAVPALWLARKDRKTLAIIGILMAQMILELISISLSGLTVTHYYLPLVSTFALLTIFSLAVILKSFSFRVKLIVKGIALGVILNFVFNIDLPESPRISRYDQVAEYLHDNRNENDKLFVENAWHSSLYVISNMTSDASIPTPLFHYFMIQDKYNHERVSQFTRSLKSKPPRFIITSNERGMLQNHQELNAWFYGLYKPTRSFDVKGDELQMYELSVR